MAAEPTVNWPRALIISPSSANKAPIAAPFPAFQAASQAAMTPATAAESARRPSWPTPLDIDALSGAAVPLVGPAVGSAHAPMARQRASDAPETARPWNVTNVLADVRGWRDARVAEECRIMAGASE